MLCKLTLESRVSSYKTEKPIIKQKNSKVAIIKQQEINSLLHALQKTREACKQQMK